MIQYHPRQRANFCVALSAGSACATLYLMSLYKLLPALLFLTLPCLAQPFFIQGADPQFGMHAKDTNFIQETANFDFFIASVNRLRPIFVIVCGDLTNKAGDPAQIAEYHRIAKKLDPAIKLYNVAGNHDVGNDPTPESLALYRKNYGPDWYSFEAGPIYGIVLDSSVMAHPDHVAEDSAKQEKWLAAELRKARASTREIVIFQHIPYFVEKADEPDQYFNYPTDLRRKYLGMLHEAGVKYVFAGHHHRNSGGRDGNLEEVVTGPIGMPIGPDPSGFRIVTVQSKDGSLKHNYISLGAIPNRWPPPGT